jgi:hypothetical protein
MRYVYEKIFLKGVNMQDTKCFKNQGLCVFCHYLVDKDMLSDDWNRPVNGFDVEPLSVGNAYTFGEPVNVKVRPDDIIFGDIDGVCCVPREIAYNDVLVRAEEIEKNEVDIFKWVCGGDSIQDIVEKGGEV